MENYKKVQMTEKMSLEGLPYMQFETIQQKRIGREAVSKEIVTEKFSELKKKTSSLRLKVPMNFKQNI